MKSSATNPEIAPLKAPWSTTVDLRSSASTNPLEDLDPKALADAYALAQALGAQLEVDPVRKQAGFSWPEGGIHSNRLRDELYLRTGVLLDLPVSQQSGRDTRLPLPLGLSGGAYGEAAKRIRSHAFCFWQRHQIPGVL